MGLLMADGAVRGPELGVLEELARPRWSVIFFVLTALGALAVAHGYAAATPAMVLPFVLFGLNLGAAVAVFPRFRRDLPLLLFHLALVAMLLLFVVGRLTYVDAGTTLSDGAVFDGRLAADERGPLHGDGIERLRFSHDGFAEVYPETDGFRATFSRVRWQDGEGRWHRGTIGNDIPLVIGNYRIYTTGNRGFSVLLEWQRPGRLPESGHVELGAASTDFAPTANWRLPDGPELWAMLELPPIPEGRKRHAYGLEATAIEHALVLRSDAGRHVLRPGDTIDLSGGRLHYQRLDSWMGYRIVYDPTRPWIAATVILAMVTLVWFYAARVFRGGWDHAA